MIVMCITIVTIIDLEKKMINYVFGLGGRNFGHKDAMNIFEKFNTLDSEFLDQNNKLRYYGIRE